MGEQHRVVTARALLQQRAPTALTEALDGMSALICVEDATVAVGLHLGAFAAVNGDDENARQRLLAQVLAAAQRACAVGRAARDVWEGRS